MESCAETARVKAWTDHISLLHSAKDIKVGNEPSEPFQQDTNDNGQTGKA